MTLATFRDPHLSRWQSAVEQVVKKAEGLVDRPNLGHPMVAQAADTAAKAADASATAAAPGASGKEGVVQAPALPSPGATVATLETCADLAFRLATAKLERKPEAEIKQLEDALAFSTCDPLWSEAVAEYIDFFDVHHGTVPYRPPASVSDPAPLVLPENATVALIADWGTGTADARALLERVKAHKPDVLIHLGDVYYSGTDHEMQAYFLDIVNEVFERGADHPLPVFNMTGNHDMYSGGGPFYRLLDKLNLPPLAPPGQMQTHSFCGLRSSGWQILILDTGLHDADVFDVATSMTYLEEPELAWHKHQIQTAGGRRTILLSHHQLFSAFSAIGPETNGDRSINTNLQKQLGDVLGQVDAWFWGHEHNLEIYGPYLGLNKGRCIGASAIPVFTTQDPYKSRVGTTIPLVPAHPDHPDVPVMLGTTPEDVYTHCYVILQLDDASRTATACYYQDTADDTLLFEETLP